MTSTNLSVTAPLESAFRNVKRVLFQPFDVAKWFVIGFCAWLAYLGQGGGGGGGGFPGNSRKVGGSASDVLEQARQYVTDNLYWLLPLVLAITVFSLALWVLVVWLSSRGRFMFLHCVALNRAEVQVPWRRWASQANSLFWFRIVATFILLIPIMPVIVLLLLSIVRMADRGVSAMYLGLAVGLSFVLLLLSIVFWVLVRFTIDFVVPIQYLRNCACMAAWRELLSIVRASLGSFLLYLLFRIVLALAIGAIVLIVVLATCCIAGCLLAIPYLGTVLMLPILVFDRSYSAAFLAQLGPDYNVFADAY